MGISLIPRYQNFTLWAPMPTASTTLSFGGSYPSPMLRYSISADNNSFGFSNFDSFGNYIDSPLSWDRTDGLTKSMYVGYSFMSRKLYLTGSKIDLSGGVKFQRKTFSNADYAVLGAGYYIVQTGNLTASRTVTLPLANADADGGGRTLVIFDESGTCGAVNTIVVATQGGDTINGVASIILNSAYARMVVTCDGVSKWSRVGS